jgi:hypothetical protein
VKFYVAVTRIALKRIEEFKMDLSLPSYKTAYINFSAEVNPTTTEQLIATCTNLLGQGFNSLYFLFASAGGSVMHGLTIYNVLGGLPAKIIFHNVGNVDSIGNAVFLPEMRGTRVLIRPSCFTASGWTALWVLPCRSSESFSPVGPDDFPQDTDARNRLAEANRS